MVELYYRFSSIHLDQFAVFEDSFKAGDEMSLSNTLNYWFDENCNQLICGFGVQVARHQGDIVLKADVSCGFEVREDTLKALTRDDAIVFPAEMLGHVASLSYSTLRGIVFSRLEGTAMHDLVLPLQNIYSNINQPYTYRK
jgi:hypothetical protein